jgi:type VI secretion system protein ImpH
MKPDPINRVESDSQPSSKPTGKRLSSLERLEREPFGFDFFQAIRLLELAASAATQAGEMQSNNPVGEDFAPSSEVVRFRVAASQSFPGSSIMAFVPASRVAGNGKHGVTNSVGSPAQMTVSFLGLTGPSGVLPQHYTQRLIDQLHEDDGMREFFDIFNHRILSQFYRVWKKYHFAISFEAKSRTEKPIDQRDLGDLFTYGLYSLVGMGTGDLRQRQAFPDRGMLYYAGQFAHNPPTAVSLERMLTAYFGLVSQVNQFQGQWLPLNRDDQTSLASRGDLGGGNGGLGSGNNQLGVTAVAGERVWSIENKFRVRLGPLDYSQFWDLSPTGSQLTHLSQMIRTYVGFDLEFDVQVVLRRDEVPACQLAGDSQVSPHLGWNTWIQSMPRQRDAEDAVFQVEGLPVG